MFLLGQCFHYQKKSKCEVAQIVNYLSPTFDCSQCLVAVTKKWPPPSLGVLAHEELELFFWQSILTFCRPPSLLSGTPERDGTPD